MALSVTEEIFITTALCGIVVLLLFFKNRRYYTEAAKIPGPPIFPIIGNLDHFNGNQSRKDHNINEVVSKQREWAKQLIPIIRLTVATNQIIESANKYPSLYRLWIGHHLLVIVYDADKLQIILNSPKAVTKGFVKKFGESWVGTGLLTAPEKKWRARRRQLAPSFNVSVLRSFIGVIAKQAEFMTSEMKKELQNEFCIRDYVGLCFMTVMYETLMSAVNVNAEKTRRYIEEAEWLGETLGARLFKLWLHPDFIFNRSKFGRDYQEHVRYMQDFARNLIQMRKNASYDVSQVKNETTHYRSAPRKPLLDHMIDLMKDDTTLTENDIMEEVITFLTAGYETVTSVICIVFLMFAIYPEVQELAYRELCEIYGEKVSSDESITENELKQMEYLERVIKETMRLFPVVWILEHNISEDLDIGDVILPKGCSVCPLIYKIHRSEKYWSDPLKFDPNRFLPTEVAKRHPYCYIPFSGGSRNCIGLNYAMISMKMLCATVLRRYILRKDDILDISDIKFRTDFTLHLEDNIKIRISER